MLIIVGYSWLRSSSTKVVRVRAVVARKRFMLPNTYCVTFGIPGGERELVVPEEVYFSADEGQWGYLVFQGEIFRQFIPEPKAADQGLAGPPKPPPYPLNPDHDEDKAL